MGDSTLTWCLCRGAVFLVAIAAASPAPAYITDSRWTQTASGSAGASGDAITLTWSLIPDGTFIPGEGSSNLIQFLDSTFGVGGGGSDLMQRPWFSLVAQSFGRWSQLGGITYVYEPHDDGITHGTLPGQVGVRGDVRIGGANVDNAGGTLAYSYFPDTADVVLDTKEGVFFGNANNNYRQFRNVLMHELGHAIGLKHVQSSTDAFLMEAAINTSYDGPQLDDIRGIQFLYGDPNEKAHNGLGNDLASLATWLGTLAGGNTFSVGTAAGPDTVVDVNDTDFVSISNRFDADYFSFAVKAPADLNVVLTPKGGTYNHGPEGQSQVPLNVSALNNLALAVFDTSGTIVLASADNTAAGLVEALADVHLAVKGQYYVRVTGNADFVQLYQLDLSLASAVSALPGDYNFNGTVDAADYAVWRDMRGATGSGLVADGNGSGVVDQADYDVWLAHFGQTSGTGAANDSLGVPEPSSAALAAIVAMICGWLPRPRSRTLHSN